MPDLPRHVVKSVKRHQWIIGSEFSNSMTARELRDGLYFAQKDMQSMGIDTGSDDAFRVSVGDNQIILSVEVEE